MGLRHGFFRFPMYAISFIDEAVQVKISFVSKPNAAHMDIAIINPLYHIFSECLSCINGSSAEGMPN